MAAMLRLLIASIFLFHAHVWAAEPGLFLNPPTGGPINNYTQDPVYKLGEIVPMRWVTTFDNFSILLWQNDNDQYEMVEWALQDVNTYNWTVSTERDIKVGNVFFFQIRSWADTTSHFASHYFNLTDDDSTSATATPSSASPTPISSTTSSTEPSTDSSSKTSGLSPQAKVGIGVGVGLGGAFLFIIAGIIWYFRRRAQRDGDGSPDVIPPAGAPMTGVQMSSSHGIYELPAKAPPRYPAEVSAENERYEMPS